MTKRTNPWKKQLEYYRELLKKYQDYEEVEAALKIDISRMNLQNICWYAAYYHGAMAGMRLLGEHLIDYTKGDDNVYAESLIRLVSSDVRNANLFLDGYSIAFRNHQRKGKKLIKVDSYFYERISAVKTIE